jgi:hypothetical protein
MYSYETDIPVHDCISSVRYFSACNSVNPVTMILSCSLFLASLAGFVFEPTQVSCAQTEKVLHSFCSLHNCVDGAEPAANLVRDEAGNLYGTTASGGMIGGLCQSFGCGIVFEHVASGGVKILYRFSASPDGAGPISGWIRDSQGNLYGTTVNGGNAGGICGIYGCGTVFELIKKGETYTEKVLYAFAGGADGLYPSSGLIQDSDGNLYGTTPEGGSPGCASGAGCGTAYKLTSLGNLYGTTFYGDAFGDGVLFEVTP